MISFNSDVNTESVLEMFQRILLGMSVPNFDDGTGIAKRAGICNMEINNFSIFINLKFDCIYGQVEIKHSTISDMHIKLLSSPIQERLDNEARQAFTYQVSDENNANDYAAIMNIVQSMGREHPEQFRLSGQFGANKLQTAVYASDEKFLAIHKDLADLLINIIGKQLGFITPSEARYLCDVFGLDSEPSHREKVSQLFASQFDTFFETLVLNNHVQDNKFDFNDLDNYLHYVVSKDEVVKGIVARSQNHMFLIAKNTDTGVIKIWDTMEITDPERLEMFYEVENSIFDGVQYMCSMLFSLYGQKYYYPCEFESPYYRKTPETLIENFDSEQVQSHLIYSSDTGFYTEHHRHFDHCISELDFAFEVVTSEYGVEQTIINNSSIDYRSPTYVIRKLTNDGTIFTNRMSALSYVLTTLGHDYYWEQGGIVDGSNYIENLEHNDFELKTNKFESDVFHHGKACLMFHRPADISEEWLSVIREFVGQYKEWVENHPDKASAGYIEAKGRLDELVTI